MTTQLPEALWLAEKISDIHCHTENEARAIAAAADSLRRQHARIAELEAQLESIGAGGVSGPLMGCASIAASAGSEPVIGWHAFPHYLQHPDGRLLRTASDLLARHGYHGCAEPLRAMSDVLLPTNPSPPEGMEGGWTKASQQLPPCRDDQLYVGINTAGFVGVFNAVIDIAGNVHCMYVTPEEAIDVMGSLDIWQPLTPPTTSAGSGNGE